ncbi:MAG: HAD family hydrolase, partial [candidate division Zixibacteria bacterium]|nr:HAD family hydrolase [candidate division Zixibacteria bacterium]
MRAVLCDMDGVIIWDNNLIEGSVEFIRMLRDKKIPYLFLTNYPSLTPIDLKHRLSRAGLDIEVDHFYTSAMATATFLEMQESGDKVYVIGEGALTHELYKRGFTISDQDVDYVVLGETRSYNFEKIEKAISLIRHGARFIATNPDVSGPSGFPSCGALVAPIEKVTKRKPFYVGKPNPFMMRAALRKLGSHSAHTVIIGDNMETDIIAGIESGLKTILVLSGVHSRNDLKRYP